MSESSGAAPSVDSDSGGVDAICMRIHKKLTASLGQPLPVSAHKSAVASMLKARDALMRGVVLSQSSKMALLCAGITCMKRVTFEIDTEDQMALLKKTKTLIFSLLVMSEGTQSHGIDYTSEGRAADGEEGADGDDGEGGHLSEADISEREASGNDARPSKSRRVCVRDDTQLIASWQSRSLAERIDMVGEALSASSWDTTLKSDQSVSKAALREAHYVKETDGAMEQMSLLSDIFMRCSASVMMSSLINNSARPSTSSAEEDPCSFLTLDTVGMLNSANEMQDEKLTALADVAESEAGQAVLRDIILSFKLPTKAVGVRRSVCLTREANAFATKQYPEILNSAHEAAMRGAMWSYESDPDPIHKMSALLAGLALAISKQKDDIRKGSAFGGRVLLPFLDCPPAPPCVSRMSLVPGSGDWAVYTTDKVGNPRIRYKGPGYDGFCQCVLLLSKSLLR